MAAVTVPTVSCAQSCSIGSDVLMPLRLTRHLHVSQVAGRRDIRAMGHESWWPIMGHDGPP